MSDIAELQRKAEVYREIIKTIPESSADREGYVKTLASIESEIQSVQQPAEDVQKDVPEVATEVVPVTEEPAEQTEELVLPKGKPEEKKLEFETEGKPAGKEPVDRIAQIMGVLRAVQKILNTPVFGEKKKN